VLGVQALVGQTGGILIDQHGFHHASTFPSHGRECFIPTSVCQ
jgi:hypothetical protein